MSDEYSTNSSALLGPTNSLLTAIVARILQVSDAKGSVALGAATNALASSAFASTVMGAVGSLGTAGTGVALAGLSGAAKTTATLYWIGGVVGGGVAAGTVVLGVGALGAGIYGSVKVRKALLGFARRKEAISDREQRILQAIQALTHSLNTTQTAETAVSKLELKLFSRVGLSPVLSEVTEALADGCFDDLTTYNRARLRGHVINLRKLQTKMDNL
ncbi:MAG: hypothetical protein ACR2O2_03195 [Ruegeria sp.]